MKYLVLLCDGMADTPSEMLAGATPMERAKKENMEALAASGTVGMVRTVPRGMKPGSDVANLSVMGYDPERYYTGRSPLEAANMGIRLSPSQYAVRCNLVTLGEGESFAGRAMEDYCAGDISSEEAAELIRFLAPQLPEGMRLYPGVSYRHCLTWENPEADIGELTPPHDIPGRKIGGYLPGGKAQALRGVMEWSAGVLPDHPVNRARIAAGKRPANAVWLWGQGRQAALPSFSEQWGLKGAVISAVDLIKGIGRLSGMEVIDVPGATGYIDTNFSGKAEAAIRAFREGVDLVYLHLEAPDECGHRGEAENKVRAIETIDRDVLGPVLEALAAMGDYRVLVLPDHPTPLAVRTHTADPVPFLLYDSRSEGPGAKTFTEAAAAETGLFVERGDRLMGMLLER